MSFLSNVRLAVQRPRRGSGRACTHVDQIRDGAPSSERCAQCVGTGDPWVFPNWHAYGAGRLIARSKEPGEDWLWCYVDDAFVRAEVP
jgi:hypothetical protein